VQNLKIKIKMQKITKKYHRKILQFFGHNLAIFTMFGYFG